MGFGCSLTSTKVTHGHILLHLGPISAKGEKSKIDGCGVLKLPLFACLLCIVVLIVVLSFVFVEQKKFPFLHQLMFTSDVPLLLSPGL